MFTRVALAMVRFYQRYLSPLKPPSCIYSPTCSEYTYQAIAKYGAVKGIAMGVERLMRCHPFSAGGHDPVP
ncbi:MAG: membrane protein insertion efficiency factor YidD [Roseiflexaceae bacterium]